MEELTRTLARGVSAGVASVVPAPVRATIARPWVHGLAFLGAAFAVAAVDGPTSYNAYVTQLVAIYAIATLGLNIPAGYGGALSLGHGGAFALGAYATAVLASTHGWPIWLTLPVSIAFGFGVGLLMGMPAGRLGTIGLAMVSLGYAIVISDMLLELPQITGGSNGISNIVPRLDFGKGSGALSSIWSIPIMIFMAAYLVYLVHWRYRTSRFGRATLATRDDEIGAMAVGISPYWIKVGAFAVGSAIGALAGALFGYLSMYISPDAVSPQLSILFLVMLVLGGAGSRVGPVIGATILGVLPLWLDKYPHANVLVYGGILVLVVLVLPRGVVGRTAAAVADPFASLRGVKNIAQLPDAPAMREVVLTTRGVGRSFGGVAALRDVDLALHAGEVLGIIGPNGSGKTTFLNVVSGLYRADGGEIRLRGHESTPLSPSAIADLGLGRTFQTPKVFPSLSIGEHMAIAAEHVTVDRSDAERAHAVASAYELLRLGSLDPDDPRVLGREARGLAHGQLRFLEIAMAVYRAPHVLLLDEPAAGLSHADIDGLEKVARRLADRGMAIVIVEHHLDLVRRLVDRIAVFDVGRVLWQGPPDELESAEEVRVAYLGIRT